MTKYHITEKGDPAPCHAEVRACPRGGEKQHYDSKEAARAAYERKMDTLLKLRAGHWNTKPYIEVAEDPTIDVEDFKLLAESDDYRVLLAVAKNPNTPFLVLEQVFERCRDEEFARDSTDWDDVPHPGDERMALVTEEELYYPVSEIYDGKMAEIARRIDEEGLSDLDFDSQLNLLGYVS